MEVDTDVKTKFSHLLYPLDSVGQHRRRFNPSHWFLMSNLLDELRRDRVGWNIPVAFIFTAANPCAFLSLAPSTTSLGLSPPIQPYTFTRSRTFPPKSCQIGTPSFFPLISHRAISKPDKADFNRVNHQFTITRVLRYRRTISTGPPR